MKPHNTGVIPHLMVCPRRLAMLQPKLVLLDKLVTPFGVSLNRVACYLHHYA
jgi:hypothetical protein